MREPWLLEPARTVAAAGAAMKLHGAEIVDTFAEAFPMWGARVVITAATPAWALEAGRSMTGFATSVIGCKCEAGIERELDPDETPDGRPGVSALLFAMDREGVGKRLVERVGQSVLTCPTTACFNGLDAEDTVDVGGQLRFFGDGYQASKVLDGRRYWRVPVMEGEFLVQERFGVVEGVAGGNIIMLGARRTSRRCARRRRRRARCARVEGVIMPFPGGIARSGSKVGSRYSALPASTNDALCPTLRGQVEHTDVPPDVEAVFEIVIDGLALEPVREAMRRGLVAAAEAGASHVTAGNYGGNLGPHHIHLRELRAMTLTLTLREQPDVPLEAEVLRPDRLAGASREEIEALPVWHGNERTRVGEFFAVSGRRRRRAPGGRPAAA